jgi:hypothetical protein
MKLKSKEYTCVVYLMEEVIRINHQIELSDDEIKTIIALLRFSIDACPIENLPEHKIEIDTVNNLVSKFEQTLK